MTDYIERGALKEYLYGGKFQEGCTGCDEPGEGCIECIVDEIDNFPAADVAPVVHGKWVHPHWKNSNYFYDCSVCGREVMHQEYKWGDKKIYTICPNCGAKMEVGNG